MIDMDQASEEFVIYKYVLERTVEEQEIKFPGRSAFLDFKVQGTELTIWCLVDLEDSETSKKFRIHGTGHKFSADMNNWEYCGTVQDREFVWHLFERLAEDDND